MLGETVEQNVIEHELKLFLNYGVSVQEAKRSVIKKLGYRQSASFSQTAVDKNLSAVLEGDNNINIKVKIISIDTKTVNVDSEEKEIFYGIIADDTSSMPFTAWHDFELVKDSVVQIKGAYVKGFRSELQVNFGDNSKVVKLVDEELSGLTPEKLAEYRKSREIEIGQLKSGMSNITVIGRVIDIESREVLARGENKIVYSGRLGDSSGKVQFSAWHDFKLQPGHVIKISQCYVKNWRGIPQLSFDEKSNVEFMEDGSVPDIDHIEKGTIRHLIDFEDLGGGFDVTIEGVVLELRTGSGIIKRCPECRRVLQDEQCMVHGAKPEGLIDLRIKAMVDDGTGSFMVVAGGELTEVILGITSEEYRANENQPSYKEDVLNRLEEKMLIQRYRFRGNVTRDNFGFMMIAQEISPAQSDIPLEAQQLLEKMGGV